jgi:hypothetical protein
MGAVQVGINNDNNGAFLLQIYLCKINFYPGETLLGEIKLFLKTNLLNSPQLIKSPTVSYTLIHREYWQNHENYPQSNNKSSIIIENNNPLSDEGKYPDDCKHYQEKIIFSKKEPYYNLPNAQFPEVVIPFQVLIPENANPSLEFVHTAKIYAYSRTYLNIEFPDTGNKAKLLIFIQKFPKPLKSELTIIKSVTKKKLGFIGSGNNVNFQGSYPKNCYSFNEICPINIKLDTFGSKENIKSISVILKRKINFLQNGIAALFKFNEYATDLWQNTMSSFEKAQDFNFNIPIIETDKVFMLRKSLYFDVNSVSKQNLICLLPSYVGQFIKCEYFFQIKVNFDSMLLKDPEFIMPLDIGHLPTLFNQNCMFDVNKIFSGYNGSINIPLMMPCFISDNSNDFKKDENIQKAFGLQKQDVINNIEQSFNKPLNSINNNINDNNISDNNINVNNINNINDITPGNNNQQSNQQINYNNGNNISNPYQDINLENSGNLPSLEEINSAKNEQPAPGLIPDK